MRAWLRSVDLCAHGEPSNVEISGKISGCVALTPSQLNPLLTRQTIPLCDYILDTLIPREILSIPPIDRSIARASLIFSQATESFFYDNERLYLHAEVTCASMHRSVWSGEGVG